MYQNEYDKSLEYVKTAVECIKDYQNIKRCEQSILQFTRENAWQCLQDMHSQKGNLLVEMRCLR